MFTAALFTTAKKWRQPKCPSMDEWIKKMWHIYTMEHYSAIKQNEILSFVTTWLDLEGIMLSEISQIEKDQYYMNSQIENRLVVVRGGEWGVGEMCEGG